MASVSPRKYRRGINLPARELEHKVFELKRQGKDEATIAKELLISKGRVTTLYRRVYVRSQAQFNDEVVARERQLDISRCEQMLLSSNEDLERTEEMVSSIYEQVMGREPRVVMVGDKEIVVKDKWLEGMKIVFDGQRTKVATKDNMLRALKRRAELQGLDMPVAKEQDSRQPVTISVNYTNQPINNSAEKPSVIIETSCQPVEPQNLLPE